MRGDEVDLYNVNIPMVEGLLSEEGLRICWTHMWRNSYGRLFKAHTSPAAASAAGITAAGPDSTPAYAVASIPSVPNSEISPGDIENLVFKFARM